VCIGGDGSLTGANQFRNDWVGLKDELLKAGHSFWRTLSIFTRTKKQNFTMVFMDF